MSRITALAAVLVLVLAGCSDSDMAVEPRESPQTRESPQVAMGLDDVNMIRSATPIPKLNVYISGPTEVSEPGLYTFTAVAPDDDGTWEYMWDIDYVSMAGNYGPWGPGKSRNLNIAEEDGDIRLTVTATKAGRCGSANIYITNRIGGNNCHPFIIC